MSIEKTGKVESIIIYGIAIISGGEEIDVEVENVNKRIGEIQKQLSVLLI